MATGILQYRPFGPVAIRKSDAAVTRFKAVIHKAAQPDGAASGQNVGDQMAVAAMYSGTPASGSKFVGIALADVIDANLTQRPRSGLKPSTQVVGEPFPIGQFCELLVPSTVVTGTPTPNAPAYLGANSTFAVTNPNEDLPAVGTFQTAPDADGNVLLLVKAV